MTTSKLLGVAALGLAALISTAQVNAQVVVDQESAGLIGKRYIGGGFFVQDVRDLDTNVYGGGVGINLPVASQLDLGFGYSYQELDEDFFELTQHSVGLTATTYTREEKYTAFLTGTLGYSWADVSSPFFSGGFDDEETFYSIGTGVEVPFNNTTAGIVASDYNDSTESGADGYWTFQVGVSHWVTKKVAIKADLTFVENDAVVYGIGLRVAL